MHRSGTSSLAGTLENCGLLLGRTVKWAINNPKGNKENRKIRVLNDAVLHFNNGDWRHPPKNLLWSDQLKKRRNRIVQRIQNKSNNTWGFKDPRTVLTLPFWIDGIQNIQLVATYRNPLSVSKSLNKAWGTTIDEGLELWYNYNSKIMEYFKQSPFPIICFDSPHDEYLNTILRLSKYLMIRIEGDKCAEQFFDRNLINHNNNYSSEKFPAKIDALYQEMISIYHNHKYF